MTWGAVAIGGATLVSGFLGHKAAKDAGKVQSAAGQAASTQALAAGQTANTLQDTGYQQQLGFQQPYLQGGGQAYQQLLGGMGVGGDPNDPSHGEFRKTFAPSDLTTDPSYQWRLDQGLQALKASRNATGNLQTGQGLKDIVNYGQGAASQEYQSAYDRFMRNQETAYGRLSGLATTGINAAGTMSNAASSMAANKGQNIMGSAANSGNFLTGAAASQAAGMVGGANAITGAINNGANTWMGYQYLNKKYPNSTGTAPGGVGGNQRGFDPYSQPGYVGGGEGE